MENKKEIVVLYPYTACNLKCRYCFIDKNPALGMIDNAIAKSFQSGYYLDFAKKIFPDRQQLHEMQFWGGEPTFGFPRVAPLLPKFLDYYPELTRFMNSTNATRDLCKNLKCLWDVLRQYPNRQFVWDLQISLDGPEWITDAGRGAGVTKAVEASLHELAERSKELLPPNVRLELHFKATLDSGTLRMLNTKDKIIEYYRFFDEYNKFFAPYQSNNFHFYSTVPNFAVPSPYTQEDGLLFADFCRMCDEIGRENLFYDFRTVMPYSSRGDGICGKDSACCLTCLAGGNCHTIRNIIGLLPNEMLSGCHMAFVDLISDYRRFGKLKSSDSSTIDFKMFSSNEQSLCFPYEDLKKMEDKMEHFFDPKTTGTIANLTTAIRVLAATNQIDAKYKDPLAAVEAANFMINRTSHCVRDDIATTGSLTMFPYGLIRLILNGAKEYIELW